MFAMETTFLFENMAITFLFVIMAITFLFENMAITFMLPWQSVVALSIYLTVECFAMAVFFFFELIIPNS